MLLKICVRVHFFHRVIRIRTRLPKWLDEVAEFPMYKYTKWASTRLDVIFLPFLWFFEEKTLKFYALLLLLIGINDKTVRIKFIHVQ